MVKSRKKQSFKEKPKKKQVSLEGHLKMGFPPDKPARISFGENEGEPKLVMEAL